MFDFSVFIGRFQPFHNGHKIIIDEALKQSKKVIVLIGSANSPSTIRNPFSYEDRKKFILSSYDQNDKERIIIVPLNDIVYNDAKWIKNVQDCVYKHTGNSKSIALVGHKKDNTSYYLSLFPYWHTIDVMTNSKLFATGVRYDYFRNKNIEDYVSPAVNNLLNTFKTTAKYSNLIDEFNYIGDYRSRWAVAPYEPTFITTDAVVIQSGYILLIERKNSPGKGLYALPGGFVNTDERLKDACIRELREETKLKVPDPVLYGSITKEKTYDDPFRSLRGRTITQAFLIELKNNPNGLPKVKGSDDAKDAFWLPLNELSQSNMFEDHYSIIQDLLGL